MSQKRSTGRQFTVDLFDDNSEDDFDNMDDVGNLTLAELFTQEEVRRAGRERRECEERERRDREESQIRRSQTEENTLSNSGTVILCMVHFFVNKLQTGSQIDPSQTKLSPSKGECLRCKQIFRKASRAEYEEFKVVDSHLLCGDCYHAQLIIETDLWTQEMRRNHGPAWDGFPTRKKVNFKKPIRVLSSSSSSASGSALAVASSHSIPKGFFLLLFATKYH
jgi:hypothetical protein